MLIFKLEVLKGKPTMSIWIMAHVNFSKTYICETKNVLEKTKIAIHMDLWKYGQILLLKNV
jgi:hypothetical protein